MTTQSEMLMRARASVLSTATWVNADQLCAKSGAIQHSDIHTWLLEDRIFAIDIEEVDYFPLYCFDANARLIPLPGIQPIVREFRKKRDDWGIAYWFCGANGYLGGPRPLDLVQHQPDLVLAAAKREILGTHHG